MLMEAQNPCTMDGWDDLDVYLGLSFLLGGFFLWLQGETKRTHENLVDTHLSLRLCFRIVEGSHLDLLEAPLLPPESWRDSLSGARAT